ncbi:MAG: glutamate synthase subunit beta [Coriobacteriales bacterium]|jgi:glutamate synthase (NADPH/NADH) small chain|nr:glutamate synthase subunit beta [Coriobacteriales bacterium]
MGKPTGFLEYQRKESGRRSVRERILDYQEFLLKPDVADLQTQGARCMDCGVSFCHAGIVIDGQSIGCPLANLISETNDLVYRGNFAWAYERLRKTHPFPEFTSKVCPALCEGSCAVGEHGEPVAIKEIERFLVGFAADKQLDGPRRPALSSGRRVAVVGSGPAGLAAADLLNQLGEEVTVFERNDRPGGLLMYGIPNMKLNKDVINRRITIMEAEGIHFQTKVEVGVGLSVDVLLQDFDALILAGGATQPRLLSAPGANLEGVVPAVHFLTQATKRLLDPTSPAISTLDAARKDVVVIGGGDTGTDCVATAIRQGAASVMQIEIMPEASQERPSGNPWPLWPRVLKTDYGQKEAMELFGSDPRQYLTTVTEVLGKDGKVSGVKTVRVEWQTKNGRMIPVHVAGSEKMHPAGLVLVAMGFLGPEKTLLEALGLAADARGNVQTPPGRYNSTIPAIFAAGDMRRGQSLVVWALMEGRGAARQCHDYLSADALPKKHVY